jgi:hypothetical protein
MGSWTDEGTDWAKAEPFVVCWRVEGCVFPAVSDENSKQEPIQERHHEACRQLGLGSH